jgi:hypothetical protein
VLVDLATLQHLARGGEAPGWMRLDDEARPVAEAASTERAAALAGTRWAALAAAWGEPAKLGERWVEQWRQRWPQRDALEPLALTLEQHQRAFERSAAGQGWMLRDALRLRLSLLMRRFALQPAAPFVHVALLGLELERLRAELLRRLYFPAWKDA